MQIASNRSLYALIHPDERVVGVFKRFAELTAAFHAVYSVDR